MIGQSSSDVIIHMAMEPVLVRFQGRDIKAMRPADRSFCWVETDDGDADPISHPLELFFMDLANQKQAGNSAVGSVYFVIDPPGDRSNDGQDDKGGSVNNLHSAL